MRRQLNILLATVCTVAAGCLPLQAQENDGFVLRGYMPGLPDSIRVEIADMESKKEKVICDTVPSNGTFVLKGKVTHPTFCQLRFLRYSKERESYAPIAKPTLMIENHEMTFRCDQPLDSLRNSYQPELMVDIDGGNAQDEYMNALRATAPAELKARLAGYKEASKYFESSANPDTVRKYLALTRAAEAEYKEAQKDFIRQHPDFHISAYWVEKELETLFVYDEQELRAFARSVSSCPDTARTARIARKLDTALRYALGRTYTDFKATTPDLTQKALSEVVSPGKYLLIDFWASWCGPCRSAIPHVAELYEQYKDQLDVCSVSLDEKEQSWRKAMEEEKMSWTQLWSDKEQAEDICKAYYITSIPRLILLNDKGEIICSTFRPDDIADTLKQHIHL